MSKRKNWNKCKYYNDSRRVIIGEIIKSILIFVLCVEFGF